MDFYGDPVGGTSYRSRIHKIPKPIVSLASGFISSIVRWFCLEYLPQCSAHAFYGSDDQGVAHAKETETVAHASVRPVVREALDAFGFDGGQFAEPMAVQVFDDMGAAVRSGFTREHGAGGLVDGVREGDGAFGEDIFMAIASGPLDFLGTFEVGPFIQVIAQEESFRYVVLHDVFELDRVLIDRDDGGGSNPAVVHVAGMEEVMAIGFCQIEQINRGQAAVIDVRCFLDGECTGEEAFLVEDGSCILCIGFLGIAGIITIGEDEGAAPPLCKAIIGCVDDTPFYTIAQRCATGKDDAEVAAPLACRGAQQPVHVFQEDKGWPLGLHDVTDLPPKDALFALDACCTGAGNGIVLAWEATDQEVMVRKRGLIDGADIGIDMVGGDSKMCAIAVEGILARPSRFPLVGPDSFPVRGSTFQADPETAHPGKKLTYSFSQIIHTLVYCWLFVRNPPGR